MVALVDKLKREGKGKRYDATVGLSGGIDSAYLLHHMVRERGLRLLVIHVDAGWNSEPAVHNIEALVRALDLDLTTFVVEWEEMRSVQHAFFRAGVFNQDFPQDHAFFATLIRVARRHGVRSFLSGVNFATENIHVPHDGPSSTDGKHIRAICRQFTTAPLTNYPIMTMAEYLLSTKLLGYPSRYRPLDFLDYNKEDALQTLQRHYNWRDYGSKHSESRFTKFYQDIYLPTKVGFDKRRLHLSSLIVSGQEDRENALNQLEIPPITDRQMKRELQFIAKKMGFHISELEAYLKAPLVSHNVYASDKSLSESLLSNRAKARHLFSGWKAGKFS